MFSRAPLWPQFLHPLKTTFIGPGFVPDSYKRIWVLISPFFLLPRSPRHQKPSCFLETRGSESSSMRCGCLPQILLALQNMGPKSSLSVHKAHLPIRCPARDPSQEGTPRPWAAEAMIGCRPKGSTAWLFILPLILGKLWTPSLESHLSWDGDGAGGGGDEGLSFHISFSIWKIGDVPSTAPIWKIKKSRRKLQACNLLPGKWNTFR